ncbi:STAS domain-containing protein [Seonamhaeicola maritimus]|uniref:STAS domain-containing protein n=1 Tax=Seonamhaeicola maritimus TaxID=2591822 RepID=UPI002494C2A3|nr:STAS domain-containing protein [Seonamhaeicola maritimus]
MELKITSFNNYFEIYGTLNRKSVNLFQQEFSNIFDEIDSLTISLEGVERMDRFGVKAITELSQLALDKNKSLAIIGYGCNDLYNHFKTVAAA